MRVRVLVLVLTVLLPVSCRAEPTVTTGAVPGAGTPEAAVKGLTEALANGDWDSAAPFADEAQVAMLISIEGVPAAETAEMLRSGVPVSVMRNFWRSFTDGYLTFSEEEMADLLIGEGTRFEFEGVPFGEVEVSLRHQAGLGAWVAREENGVWRVDLFATFGPSLAKLLREWLERLPDDDHGQLIRAEMAAQERSFTTALTLEPLGKISDGARFEVKLLMLEAGG